MHVYVIVEAPILLKLVIYASKLGFTEQGPQKREKATIRLLFWGFYQLVLVNVTICHKQVVEDRNVDLI
jgi:hypothetical protein